MAVPPAHHEKSFIISIGAFGYYKDGLSFLTPMAVPPAGTTGEA